MCYLYNLSTLCFTGLLFFVVSVDSWLEDGMDHGDGVEGRIHSGYSSPQKHVHSNHQLRPTVSASTVDSFDNAFGRKPPSASNTRTINVAGADEFFDS